MNCDSLAENQPEEEWYTGMDTNKKGI